MGILDRDMFDSRFLKFDPSAIKYMPVQALPLRPDLAKVGVEIRVVGYLFSLALLMFRNDAGEKLSYASRP